MHAFTYAEWLERWTPLMGADDTDVETPPSAEADADDSQDESPDPKNTPADAKDEPDSDDEVKLSAKAYREQQAELARLRKADKKRENDAKLEREKQQVEQGKFEELAKEREQERDEAAAKLEAKEFEMDQLQRSLRTHAGAQRLNFRDPEDAFALLDQDDTESDEKVEKALKKLAEAKPYLLNDRQRSGRSGNGSGGRDDDGLSIQDIKEMSTVEVAARMKDVKATLAKQQPKKVAA